MLDLVYNSLSCLLHGLEVCWVSGFDQSFGISECQKLICSNCRGQPSDYLEEGGQFLLFSFILKRLQSEASQHVGDTLREWSM